MEEIRGKRVIEIGSRGAGIRPLLESWSPSEYIGVDIQAGLGVDSICNAEDLIERFGERSFDVVISTEMLEHVRNWRKVIHNMKYVCKPDGLILITTRSYGFSFHSAPFDFWRYEIDDIHDIFSDCLVLNCESDYQDPGVFAKIRKPEVFAENDLTNYKLYSIITNNRTRELTKRDFQTLRVARLLLILRLRKLIIRIYHTVFPSYCPR